jgi:hypothetical protein
MLSFPLAMKIILMISFLITVYLIIFLLFNLRQDDITIIQSRLKKLQVNLLEEYYEHAEDLNWNRWKRELEHRRGDIHAELKRGLNTRAGAGGFAEIDLFIDRSWDDLVAITGRHVERRAGIDEDTLRALLSRLLPEASAAAHRALNEAELEGTEEIDALNEADIVEALEGPAETKLTLEAPEPELERIEELEELTFEELELEDFGELEAVELDLVEPGAVGSAGPEAGFEPEAPGAPSGAPEPELTELEAVGSAGPEAGFEPEAPGAPSGAPEPELTELEAVGSAGPEAGFEPEAPGAPSGAPEPELAELEPAEPEVMMKFYGLDPLAFEDSNESETAIDTLVSAIEFSPDPKEVEWEKEQAAKSMAEHVEIQSPFASIFSTLSEVEFEPEPMEDLESLEKERLAPDDSPETEAEELHFSVAGPQLSIPFLEALNSEIIVLTAEYEDEDAAPEEADAEDLEREDAPEEAEANGVITERDGLIYINESVLSPDKETLKGLDKNFKNLIDSILNNT